MRASSYFIFILSHTLNYKLNPKKEPGQSKKGLRIFKTKVLSRTGLFDISFHYPEALDETEMPPSILFVEFKL
jgi:hypothetical protein